MKILFVAPCYHINLHFFVKALKDTGHDVEFLAIFKVKSENYEFLKPKVVSTSFLYKQLVSIIDLFITNKTKNN